MGLCASTPPPPPPTPPSRPTGPVIEEARYQITFLLEHEIIGEFGEKIITNPLNSSSNSFKKEMKHYVYIKSIHSSVAKYVKSYGMKVGDVIETISVEGPDGFEHEVISLDDTTTSLLTSERPIIVTCFGKRCNESYLRYWKGRIQHNGEFGYHITNHRLGEFTDSDIVAIGEILKTEYLNTLNLYSSNITDVQSIGETLKTNNTLRWLQLSNNKITDVQSIGEALKTNKTLKLRTLRLHCNNITDVQSIGEGLKTNNTLQQLWLYGNKITDVQSIGEGLKTNNKLRELWLCGNNITDVQSIGEGLKTNDTLKVLDLRSNNITDVQSIGDALKTNKSLTKLELNGNKVTDDSGIQSIIEILKTNNTLQYLDLHNNQLSDNMKSQLNAIEQYKKRGSNGYQQVHRMKIIT